MKSIVVLFVLILGSRVFACEALAKRHLGTTHCYSFSFQSESLNRVIEGNVWLPAAYDPKGARLPYAIFLHGRYADREMFTELVKNIGGITAYDQLMKSAPRPYLIFTVSGGDHYWMNAAISKEKWGDLVTKDLIRYIESNFHVVLDDGNARALFGISMGAAGVLQLGFHAPGTFGTGVAISPVIRRETDIWTPDSTKNEPHGDHDAFGSGADFHERNPHDLCQKYRKPNGTCLPYRDFRLDSGENDVLLDKYPDSRVFITELKRNHPDFTIEIGRCSNGASATREPCKSPAQCYGHTFEYWSCLLPTELRWISERFDQKLKREPSSLKGGQKGSQKGGRKGARRLSATRRVAESL